MTKYHYLKSCKRILPLFFTLLLSGCSSAAQSGLNNSTESIEESSTETQKLPDFVTYDTEYESSTKTGSNYFQISDRYDGKKTISFDAFLKQKDSPGKLYEFHELLVKNLDYLEFYEQPLQKFGHFDGSLHYVQDEDPERLNQKIAVVGPLREDVTSLNTIEIGKTLNAELKNVITDGTSFGDSDFIYQNNDTVPVLLGSAYHENYALNDILKLNFLEHDFNFRVIGFFPEKYYLVNNTVQYNMDYFICLPFFDIPDLSSSNLDASFLFSYYLERDSCYVAYNAGDDTDKQKQQEQVRNLAEQAGVKYDANEAVYGQMYFPDNIPTK